MVGGRSGSTDLFRNILTWLYLCYSGKGLLFTFGEDENGKLGLTESQCKNTTYPQSVAKLEGDKYKQVSCGARHTVAITEKGCCYSWGDGSHGQLGHGTMLFEVSLPKQIALLNHLKIIYLSCGDGHTALITGIYFHIFDCRHKHRYPPTNTHHTHTPHT